jgi:hypothetical protein
MYLMQSYGNQDVGVDATNQTDMNQYFGDVQNLWGALYAGNVGASSDLPTITGISYNGTAVTGSPGNVFADDLYAIRYAIENDPFFKNSQGGQQMEQQLLGALNEINSISNQVSAGPGVDKIWEMWQQYNGEQGSSTVSTSGSPDAMDSMMRELGQLNQDVTGVSQSIGTQFQSDSNNQQTESAALNNYLQMLYKMNQVLIQNMQSSSS